MRILIVEDDDDKRRKIAELLIDRVPDVSVDEARSMRSGLLAIRNAAVDLLLLDMAMPTYDITVDEEGGTPQAFAGRELLRHMRELEVSIPAIVVTQFETFGQGLEALTLDQLDRQLSAEHPTYKGTVYYNSASEEWKDALMRKLKLDDGGKE